MEIDYVEQRILRKLKFQTNKNEKSRRQTNSNTFKHDWQNLILMIRAPSEPTQGPFLGQICFWKGAYLGIDGWGMIHTVWNRKRGWQSAPLVLKSFNLILFSGHFDEIEPKIEFWWIEPSSAITGLGRTDRIPDGLRWE